MGIDIIEIARIERVVARWGDRFLHKVFTAAEIAYCSSKPHPAQHYAVRFAAKEAFAKAVATGWRGAFRWHDVEIGNDAAGKPAITLHGALALQFTHAGVHLSLSHTHTVAVAMVAIE